MTIKVKRDTPLTKENVCYWIDLFESKERKRLELLDKVYKNTGGYLKLPFGKKIATISASATYGDGISIKEPEEISEKQKKLIDEILTRLNKQNTQMLDKELLKTASALSVAYELVYMSDDEIPVPKSTRIDSEKAFIVYDNTADERPLYAVWFIDYKDRRGDSLIINVADTEFIYKMEIRRSELTQLSNNQGDTFLTDGEKHNMNGLPLIRLLNNEEEQGDFEQVLDLILDRTRLHNLTLDDTERIVKNVLALINGELKGETAEDKKKAVSELNDVKVLELFNKYNDKPADAKYLSKNENYSMIEIFGKDIDSKIHELTMIPDLTSDTFAGNVTGVALEFKLIPFKELIDTKASRFIELYKERIKRYAELLTQPVVVESENGEINYITNKEYEYIDTDDLIVELHRTWTRTLTDIAQAILTLKSSGVPISDKTLVDMLPGIDYEDEKEQIKLEEEERAKRPTADANNSGLEDFNGLIRELLNEDSAKQNARLGSNNVAEKKGTVAESN